jgi:hypothetical protein
VHTALPDHHSAVLPHGIVVPPIALATQPLLPLLLLPLLLLGHGDLLYLQ